MSTLALQLGLPDPYPTFTNTAQLGDSGARFFLKDYWPPEAADLDPDDPNSTTTESDLELADIVDGLDTSQELCDDDIRLQLRHKEDGQLTVGAFITTERAELLEPLLVAALSGGEVNYETLARLWNCNPNTTHFAAPHTMKQLHELFLQHANRVTTMRPLVGEQYSDLIRAGRQVGPGPTSAPATSLGTRTTEPRDPGPLSSQPTTSTSRLRPPSSGNYICHTCFCPKFEADFKQYHEANSSSCNTPKDVQDAYAARTKQSIYVNCCSTCHFPRYHPAFRAHHVGACQVGVNRSTDPELNLACEQHDKGILPAVVSPRVTKKKRKHDEPAAGMPATDACTSEPELPSQPQKQRPTSGGLRQGAGRKPSAISNIPLPLGSSRKRPGSPSGAGSQPAKRPSNLRRVERFDTDDEQVCSFQ